jgi:hypothetical protein
MVYILKKHVFQVSMLEWSRKFNVPLWMLNIENFKYMCIYVYALYISDT